MTPIRLPENLLTIAGVQPLELEIVEIGNLGPHMRRVVLAGDRLATFTYQPGQDVMLVLAEQDGRPLSRRYTIRSFDPQTARLELNIVQHDGTGVGARWLAAARVGDRVNGVGPRGKITLRPNVTWHLFFGDDSAAPGILNMLEALPAGQRGRALIEVDGAADELPTTVDGQSVNVEWLHRGTTSIDEARLLEDAAQRIELPSGAASLHVYIAGEVYRVRGVQTALAARGVSAEQMSPKAYWGRGGANAARGEPDERAL